MHLLSHNPEEDSESGWQEGSEVCGLLRRVLKACADHLDLLLITIFNLPRHSPMYRHGLIEQVINAT